MKPNMEWSRIRKKVASKRRRFWDGVDLHLGAMRRLFERKGKKERNNQKSSNQQLYQKEEKNGTYA